MTKSKLPYQKADYFIIGFSFVFLFISWLITAINYGSLPEKIVSTINGAGDAKGYIEKKTLWFLPVLFTVINFGLMELANHPYLHNIQLKNKILQRRITFLAMPYLMFLGTSFIYLSVKKTQSPTFETAYFYYGFIGLTIMFFSYIFYLIYKNLPS